MKILFLQTGGTIDKDYPKTFRGYNFEISEPAVKRILAKVHPNFSSTIVSVLKKDSMDFIDKDRQKIYDVCAKAKEENIIITHGTDTMVQTAEKLHTITDKRIVLTGSLRPEKFSDSDAMFNIGVAVGALNAIDYGVYIAMNGRIYTWDNCEKQTTGQFLEKKKNR